MSTLTDVIAHPATAAAELDRLRAENDNLRIELQDAIRQSVRAEGWAKSFDAEVERLEQRNKRLTWALRAIDTRLHAEMDGAKPARITAGTKVLACRYAINERTLRQMCNVAVSATAERP